jgi:DNA-binding response OmpR family regulator
MQTASLDAGADDLILKQIPISDFFSRLRARIMMREAT